ncbi:YeeE/YedE family protein [Roseobacter sp. HKCCA0434]|uniref:YeeE/YedE family protein n=1 Tax=Roseobacter sp. HKCCA0434 TaxID=3079297 RepID=UPI002905F4BF|nr:YeeE/YedE family protein [Roseobacter sp. HKCCA0434]
MTNRSPFIFALGALALLAGVAWWGESVDHLWAVLIGGMAGVVLYNASFGFTAGWRNMVLHRRGRGLRAQMLLIGLIALVAYPMLAVGEVWGQPVRGVILPMGVASALGAVLFGAGMQLGSGCASGTLFTAGGGSTRMGVVLAFFILGSVLPTAHWEFWASLPRTRAGISLIAELGWPGAVALVLAGCAAIWVSSVVIERRAHGALESERGASVWPIWAGAVGLAAVALVFLVALGRPWGITYGFAVWGAQAADALGWEPTAWPYWSGWRRGHVEGGVLSSTTNAANLGILAGAMAAAAWAGRWSPVWRLSRRDVVTAVIGGLAMGYGARLAYGCNIGAYLGGLTSGSLHGLWWLVWGFAGSWLGTVLRVRIGMDARPVRAI